MKKLITLLPLLGLMACAGNELTYGNRTFNPTPEQRAQMLADQDRVQRMERAERAERRQDMKEDLDVIVNARGKDAMNQAKAYRHATQGKKYIHCDYWGRCR